MRIALLLTITLFSLEAFAEIYRWVDADGSVSFSEQPQPGAERVDVRPQIVGIDAATHEREARMGRFSDARREERQEAREAASAKRAQRRQVCEQMRNRLSLISNGGRYFVTDARGERVYYSDEDIGAARRQLVSRISQNCS